MTTRKSVRGGGREGRGKRLNLVQARLTDAEKQALGDLAHRTGLSESALVREGIARLLVA